MTLEQEVLNLDGSDAELFYERMAETASICSSRTRPFPHSWTQAIAEIFSVGSDDAGSSTSLSVFTFIMSSPAVRQRGQKDKKTPASASTSPRLDSNLNGILKTQNDMSKKSRRCNLNPRGVHRSWITPKAVCV